MPRVSIPDRDSPATIRPRKAVVAGGFRARVATRLGHADATHRTTHLLATWRFCSLGLTAQIAIICASRSTHFPWMVMRMASSSRRERMRATCSRYSRRGAMC